MGKNDLLIDKQGLKVTGIISIALLAIIGVIRMITTGAGITGAVVGSGTSVAIPGWIIFIIVLIIVVALGIWGFSKLKK